MVLFHLVNFSAQGKQRSVVTIFFIYINYYCDSHIDFNMRFWLPNLLALKNGLSIFDVIKHLRCELYYFTESRFLLPVLKAALFSVFLIYYSVDGCGSFLSCDSCVWVVGNDPSLFFSILHWYLLSQSLE